ncbi:MAG TPA: MFS transporter [Caulobacteraceae bacterium]|nr:MFS transporter [Caulobacteraceae bacterium]
MTKDQGGEVRPGWRAWATAGVLAAAGLFCAADFALPQLLVEPIRLAFKLTDTQIAILTGFSFAISLSVFALPLSWIADRFNRAILITVAIALWCSMTVGSAFATGFWSLFVLRLGVGFGEAALKPAAYALLADLFPAKSLPTALGAFAVASMLGPAIAQAGGGSLDVAFQSIAGTDAWRWTTATVGALGLLVALAAALILREPRRRPATVEASAPTLGISLPAFVRASMFFVLPFTLANITFVLWQAGFVGWVAPFFSRTYGWDLGLIGKSLGLMNLATLAGVPLGIWMSAWLRKRRGQEAPVAVTWIALAVSAPLLVLGPLALNGWLAIAAFSLVFVAGGAATVVTPIVFTSTAPPHLRARMIALSSLCYGVVGQSTGGVIFAEFTEHVAGGPAHLRVTLSVLSAVLMAACVGFLFWADQRYPAARALANTEGALEA